MHTYTRNLFYALLLFFFFLEGKTQPTDTATLNTLYERLYLLPQNQSDSIAYYAGTIIDFSKKENYTKGLAYGERLLGIAAEYQENTKEAIDHYLKFQEYAEQIADTVLMASAISDAAGIYAKILQYPKAKEKYLAYIALMELTTNRQKLAKGYSNLGVIYRKTDAYDSAIYFYRKGLAIRKELNDSAGMATVQNNIASLMLYQNKPLDALPYIEANLIYHRQQKLTEDMWFDYTNLLATYTLLKKWENATAYGDTALQIAKQLGSLNKQADTYEILVELAEKKGDYKQAYLFQSEQMSLLKQINNDENNKAIAALQESFNAEKREQENKILTAEVANQKLQNRNYILLLLGVLILAAAIAVAWQIARSAKKKTDEQNVFIFKQNQRLAELNSEKNALISIVSHDLSGPLSEIGLWHQVLVGSRATFGTEQQRKAIDRIGQATKNGEMLIRRILDVEKAETNQHEINLEEIRFGAFLEKLVQPFSQKALEKNIILHSRIEDSIEWMTDKHIFERIADNLISNAIKYTAPQKNITVSLSVVNKKLQLVVSDEGVGIAADELPNLFTKYARISSQPTGNEKSTGLGLSIVKRLADEIGAVVSVKSEEGRGSEFVVEFS
jgi:signal transduction histidine kinase